MKLRQQPSDFMVEEIGIIEDRDISDSKGDYRLYVLEKRSMETFSLLAYLSKKNRIPVHEFGIAGLKDRHAITKQYMTLPSRYNLDGANGQTKEQNFSISFRGFVSRKLSIGDLKGNIFRITVRDLRKGELDGPAQKAAAISGMGVPNYFDSQRFGSVIGGGFIAKHVMKKDYEKAAKIFLTEYSKFEGRSSKDEKRRILEHWGEFDSMIGGGGISNKLFAGMISEYMKTKSWLSAYMKIPANLRELYVSAYQSYLWNECIRETLRKTINSKYLYTIPYNIGSLLFYKRITKEEAGKIPRTFKSLSDQMTPSDFEKPIIDKVLSKEGIKLADFRIKDDTGNFFKSNDRQVIIRPEDFCISKPEKDELNDKGRKGIFKITVSFSLPKGSYATMITKRLFNQ